MSRASSTKRAWLVLLGSHGGFKNLQKINSNVQAYPKVDRNLVLRPRKADFRDTDHPG